MSPGSESTVLAECKKSVDWPHLPLAVLVSWRQVVVFVVAVVVVAICEWCQWLGLLQLSIQALNFLGGLDKERGVWWLWRLCRMAFFEASAITP